MALADLAGKPQELGDPGQLGGGEAARQGRLPLCRQRAPDPFGARVELRGHLELDAASVSGVGDAASEAGALEPVDDAGHRTAGQPHLGRQLPGGETAGVWRLELVQVPVSDVDRAKAFYIDRVGFLAEHDHRVTEELRFVQLNPPGSACSIALTTGAHQMQPGSVAGLQLVVEDADAARAELVERGVEASEVQEFPWGRFVFFTDPDGNGWAVQEIVQPQD